MSKISAPVTPNFETIIREAREMRAVALRGGVLRFAAWLKARKTSRPTHAA